MPVGASSEFEYGLVQELGDSSRERVELVHPAKSKLDLVEMLRDSLLPIPVVAPELPDATLQLLASSLH